MSYSARNYQDGLDGELFRVVIEVEYDQSGPRSHFPKGETLVFGPYSKVGPARGRLTVETKRLQDEWASEYTTIVSSRVERATVTWEEVE